MLKSPAIVWMPIVCRAAFAGTILEYSFRIAVRIIDNVSMFQTKRLVHFWNEIKLISCQVNEKLYKWFTHINMMVELCHEESPENHWKRVTHRWAAVLRQVLSVTEKLSGIIWEKKYLCLTTLCGPELGRTSAVCVVTLLEPHSPDLIPRGCYMYCKGGAT